MEIILGNIQKGNSIGEHTKSKEDQGTYRKERRLVKIQKLKKIGEHTKGMEIGEHTKRKQDCGTYKRKEDWET